MLGRPTRELRGDWEGVYRSDMVPGYPEGRFTWKVRSGLVWGVAIVSVDHTRQIPATLTGSFRSGVLSLVKQYPPGELPVLQPDGSMVSIEEALASERMQGRDAYEVRVRRVTVPVVTRPSAGVRITGHGL